MILCKAIRNLDCIEDVKLKSNAYKILVKNSLWYTFILKDYLARYANLHEGALPNVFSDITNIPTFFMYMPYNLQNSMHELMGSTKLFTPIKAKIREDNTNKSISDIERYFSIAMLWDCTYLENEREVKGLIKRIGNNCVSDYIFNKLHYRYYNFVPAGSDEEKNYISLMADLKLKNKAFKFLKKGEIMKSLQMQKKKKAHV